jgi:hypothetical protein
VGSILFDKNDDDTLQNWENQILNEIGPDFQKVFLFILIIFF